MNVEVTPAINKKAILLVVTLSSFFMPFMASSINIALPSIGKEFAVNAVILGWVASSLLLALAIFLVPIGRVADILGRRKVFIAGLGVFTVSSFLCTLSTSVIILITLRVFQGIGAAMVTGTGVAILTSVFPPGERGRALGISVTATYIGLSIGPVLGGFLTQQFGWRSIFIANGLVGLVALAVALWKLKGEWAEAKGEKFDWVGSIIYGLALLALMSGFSFLPDIMGMWLLAIGIAGVVIFIIWETRTRSPVLNISLFRNNIAFSFSNLAALINYSATFSVAFLLSLYLQYTKALSPSYAGLILLAQPVMMAGMSPVAGRLSDKIEPRIVASIGMALSTVGLILMSFLGQNTGLELVIVSQVVLGVGFAFFSSPNTNAVMSSVGKNFLGVAGGTLGTMRSLGQTLSLAIAVLLFSVYIGRVQITPEYYPLFLKAFKTAFIISSVLCFAGVFASLARGKIR